MSNQLHHSHWNHVAYHWNDWGPPLRPGPDDITIFTNIARRWQTRNSPAQTKALLWGVTPEIAAMSWPDNTELLAVDRSPEMIAAVWTGDIPGVRQAVRGHWLETPDANAEFDLVICDGGFSVMKYPAEYQSLAARAKRLLSVNGILIVRFFIAPDTQETPETVFADLLANRIGNFHIFKFRLAMALQKNAAAGVRMGEVYSHWVAAQIDIESLQTLTGWRRSAISTIDFYQDKESCLTFPRLSEIDAVMNVDFDKIHCQIPGYEMGDRCPIMCFRNPH